MWSEWEHGMAGVAVARVRTVCKMNINARQPACEGKTWTSGSGSLPLKTGSAGIMGVVGHHQYALCV